MRGAPVRLRTFPCRNTKFVHFFADIGYDRNSRVTRTDSSQYKLSKELTNTTFGYRPTCSTRSCQLFVVEVVEFCNSLEISGRSE